MAVVEGERWELEDGRGIGIGVQGKRPDPWLGIGMLKPVKDGRWKMEDGRWKMIG